MLLVVAATERELELVSGVETLCCGVGPVEAALRTARALAEREVGSLLHVGIAGARTLDTLSLVLGSEAVYCDVMDGGSRFPRITRAEPDPALLAAAHAVLPEAYVASISTCGKVGGGSDVEAMEGFAVLRAAELAGVPALELRAISNEVGEADRAKWRFEDAFAVLGDAVNKLVPVLRNA